MFNRNLILAIVFGTLVLSHGLPNDSYAQDANLPARLPREVWVGTVAQEGLRFSSAKEMIDAVLARAETLVVKNPDVICLPETFASTSISMQEPSFSAKTEEVHRESLAACVQFARKHRCYLICPTFSADNGKLYNSAFVIDRSGEVVGEYRKIHPTTGEMNDGVLPGSAEPAVIETDFGKIGIQICYDVEWNDGWKKLMDAGVDLVFWPSAFAGGRSIQGKAWSHRYPVITSTNKSRSMICDWTGEVLAGTNHWEPAVCVPINLERAFLHTWPSVQKFADIEAKYGRKIAITTFAEEEWSILESRSADVRVADVMCEFRLETRTDQLNASEQRLKEVRAEIGD